VTRGDGAIADCGLRIADCGLNNNESAAGYAWIAVNSQFAIRNCWRPAAKAQGLPGQAWAEPLRNG
jgi:hypothetical protein